MTKFKIDPDQFSKIVATSTSIRQVIQAIGLIPAGGNYHTVKNHIKKLNLNTSHFMGHGANKGKKFQPKRSLDEYLSNNQPIQSYKLKKRLISEGVFQPICSSCGLTNWLSKPIPLELDHIDGEHLNNHLSNLRLLCPNCHALTPTYRGRNISK